MEALVRAGPGADGWFLGNCFCDPASKGTGIGLCLDKGHLNTFALTNRKQLAVRSKEDFVTKRRHIAITVAPNGPGGMLLSRVYVDGTIIGVSVAETDGDMYAMLIGRPPFEGKNLIDTMTQIRQGEPVKPKKFQMALPDHLEGLTLKLLAKRPDGRYPSATALLKDFERIAKLSSVSL